MTILEFSWFFAALSLEIFPKFPRKFLGVCASILCSVGLANYVGEVLIWLFSEPELVGVFISVRYEFELESFVAI